MEEYKKNKRIVFMGTPEFAVASLKALVDEGYNVVGVLTAPDKPAGRGQQIQVSDVKKYALEQNLTILQPTNLKNLEFLEELKALKADLQIVVAFRMLPAQVWQMPPLGTFNLHASLLPNYRGAAPINWAIINGDKESGVTTFFIEEQIDTGNILFYEKVEIENNDNAGVLHDKLMELGAKLVLKTVDAIFRKKINPQPQKNSKSEHIKSAPKIFKEDCYIQWHQNSQKVYDFIRGLSPYPAAYTLIINKKTGKEYFLKIFNTEHLTHLNSESGKWIVDDSGSLMIYCESGALKIKELQLEGKKRMPVADFLRGFDFSSYEIVMNK
jgi:methionyl-tRNA formyltransferase